jgi:FtsP/CotA-like multicopper oxidase with cupredoxin domain
MSELDDRRGVGGADVTNLRSGAEARLISRRHALALGGAGLATGLLLLKGWKGDPGGATTLGQSDTTTSTEATTTTTTLPAPVDPPVGQALLNPPEILSADGVLTATLTAAVTAATINGKTVEGLTTYNGVWPSPTMRIRPGDTFKISLVNQLEKATNLHWHGFHVSPKDNSDNVFLSIDPGETYDYEVKVPEDHQSGLFWYHPHLHGQTDDQVYGGLAGAIVVDGDHAEVPGIAGSSEHLLMLKDVMVDTATQTRFVPPGDDTPATPLYTVNGQVNPSIEARPGERKLLRVGNLSNQEFFTLSLDGHELDIVAIDGTTLPEVWTVDSFELVPGSRVEFVVTFGDEGSYKFKTGGYELDFTGGNYPEATLATIQVSGDPITDTAPLPTKLVPLADIPLEDLRGAKMARKRKLVFSTKLQPDGPPDFEIDGTTFDHDRVDQKVKLDAAEEWLLVNDDDSPHPFHIHQNDFQVTKINGKLVKTPLHWNDTISIPASGNVTIRQRYTDFTGEWVYHCHILFHEDHGMMGTVSCKK